MEKRDSMKNSVTKSGFVAMIGRPNVGKSTLMNQLIGQKIAITSNKPQTREIAYRQSTRIPIGGRLYFWTPLESTRPKISWVSIWLAWLSAV